MLIADPERRAFRARNAQRCGAFLMGRVSGAFLERAAIMLLCVLAMSSLSGAGAKAQTIENIASPSGVMIHYVKCSQKSGKCMNKAARFCKGSYQVLDSESHAGGLLADVLPGPVRWYSMTFLCGKSDGAMPAFPFRGPEFVMPSIVIPKTVTTRCTGYGNSINCVSY